MELAGPVPRSVVAEHYAWADVFLLPSVCEGSATATYEAIASGIPVICTPNAGSVIEDGRQGFRSPSSRQGGDRGTPPPTQRGPALPGENGRQA